MFNKLMNNYYFGKAGKGDFTEDDLPTNRWQLFLETLRVRFSALTRLNLMYVVVWLPALIVIFLGVMGALNIANSIDLGDGQSAFSMQAMLQQEEAAETGEVIEIPEVMSASDAYDSLLGILMTTLMLLVPAIAITGPCTAGVAYVTRNWARDEHAFIWSDFKDAVKENWKQSIVVSLITGALPLVVFMGWRFYGSMAATQPIMIIPQVLILMIGIIWAISVTYMHPLIVSYRLKLRDVFRNAILLAVARLPMSVGLRILHCVPVAIGLAIAFLWNPSYALLFLMFYYLLFGFSISRFITASYTNAVFDRFINSHIEGAQVNRGLRAEDDDDYDDDEELDENGAE